MGERLTPTGPFGAIAALKAALSQRRSVANDTGASLILALVFLIIAALTLTALVTFAGSGLLATAGYTSQRGLQYGASGAIEIAIQRVRYRPHYYLRLHNCLGTTPNTSSSVRLTEFQLSARYRVYCQGRLVSLQPTVSYTAMVSGNGITVTTSSLFNPQHPSFVGYGFSVAGTNFVTTVVSETPTTTHTVQLRTPVQGGPTPETVDLFSPYQRLVTFYACRKTTATNATAATTVTSATTCVTHTMSTVKVMTPRSVLVKAVVGFGDFLMPTGKNQCVTTPAPPATACGTSYVVTQWTVTSANH